MHIHSVIQTCTHLAMPFETVRIFPSVSICSVSGFCLLLLLPKFPVLIVFFFFSSSFRREAVLYFDALHISFASFLLAHEVIFEQVHRPTDFIVLCVIQFSTLQFSYLDSVCVCNAILSNMMMILCLNTYNCCKEQLMWCKEPEINIKSGK